jgi:hypothetical protein
VRGVGSYWLDVASEMREVWTMDPIDILRSYVLLDRVPTEEERRQATAALLILHSQRASWDAIRAATREARS